MGPDSLADPTRPRINFTSGRRENDPSLVQVFSQEKSLAVRIMYDFSTLLEHLHFSELWDSWKSTTRRSMTISTAGSVQQERMCKPEASNAEQGEEVCHQGWRFTLLSQGMEEGNVAFPVLTALHHQSCFPLGDRQVLGLVPYAVCRT